MSRPDHLGIDFGTSHTVAVLRHDDGTTAPLLFDGSPLLASAVFADASGALLTGADAVHSARMAPSRFEPNPKRRVDDGSILLGDNEFEVTKLFATVLGRVRAECERVTGVLPAVTVTHPAAWGPSRRQVLEDAAELAGLAAARLVPEPVAAATYFTSSRGESVPVGSAVVVYDFGGGTFDASVVSRTEAGFEVLAVDGSQDLGGVDVDHALVDHIGRQFAGEPGWAALLNPDSTAARRHRRTFYEDVRIAKERLSRQTQVDIPVPILDVDIHLTREELEAVTRPLLDKAVRITGAVVRDAKLPADRIAGVFLVGGASRMPLAATMLHQAIGIAPTVIDQPELVVAHGATVLDTEPVPAAVEAVPAAVSPPAVSPPVMSPPLDLVLSPPAQPVPSAPQPTPPVAPVAEAPRWVPMSQVSVTGKAVTAVRKPLLAQVLMIVQCVVSMVFLVAQVGARLDRISNWGEEAIGYKYDDEYNSMPVFAAPDLSENLLFLPIALGILGNVALAVTALRLSRREPRSWRRARATLYVSILLVILQFAISPIQRDQDQLLIVLVGPELALLVTCLFLLQQRRTQAWFSPGTDLGAPAEPGAVRTQLAQTLMWVYSGIVGGMFGYTLISFGMYILFWRDYTFRVFEGPDTDYSDGLVREPSGDETWPGFLCLLCLAVAVAVAVSAARMDRRYPVARRWGLGGMYATPIFVVYIAAVEGRAHLFLFGTVDNSMLSAMMVVLIAVLAVAICGIIVLHSRPVRDWLGAPVPRLPQQSAA